jgi:hypothetical protein
MDLSLLIADTSKDTAEFVLEHIQHFANDVKSRLERLG